MSARPRARGGELRVGFLSSVANHMMPPVVYALRARHPGVALQTRDVPIAKPVAGLRDGVALAGVVAYVVLAWCS
jgi:DNA-binding transcriptional LysR family regulator